MKRIVNVRRFIVSNLVLFVGLFVLISALVNSTYSCTEPKYKTIYTGNGDTLWNIACAEKSQNQYYRNKDVREIINDIKNVNNLKVSNLEVGQKLLIPIN